MYYPDDGNSTFLRNVPDKCHIPEEAKFVTCFLIMTYLLFDPEDGGSTFLRNVGELPEYTVSYPRRQNSSQPPL
jgi:hypothetical protein